MPSLNISRSNVSITQLRQDKSFKQLLEVLDKHLSDEREVYESAEASEFQRGRVQMMKELLGELKGQVK